MEITDNGAVIKSIDDYNLWFFLEEY
jgi:hypothetical protein